MSNINELTAKLKAAAQDEIMCREACDTSDLWQDVASPENVLALTEALEDYKAAYEVEARDKEVQRSVIDDALCKLLPGCQYMDPPDGGNVTPLAQVRRMVADYRERIAELEAREVVLPSVQDVHPLGPQSAKIFCEFHRNIINRCADEIRKVGVNVSIKGE